MDFRLNSHPRLDPIIMDAFSHVEVQKQHFINVFPLIDQARILFEQEKIRGRARTLLGREKVYHVLMKKTIIYLIRKCCGGMLNKPLSYG